MWAQTIEVRRPLVFCSFLASLLFALAAEGGGPDSAILADMRQIRKFVSVEVQIAELIRPQPAGSSGLHTIIADVEHI